MTIIENVLEREQAVREVVREITQRFDRKYFLDRALTGSGTRELWNEMAKAELFTVGVPEELGGQGGGLTECVALVEEMSLAGLPPMIYPLNLYARSAILNHGSPEQIQHYVVDAMDGSVALCFAVTEPDAGTNTFAIRSTAKKVDGGYLLNGQKVFISAADEADAMLVVARTAPFDPAHKTAGLSLFLVPMSAPGIELKQLDIRWYVPEKQFEIFLDDVEVKDEWMLGEEGKGFSYLVDSLNTERLLIAGMMLGFGQYAIDRAVEYAKVRAPFGTPIGAYQAVQHPLATAQAELKAARALTFEAARQFDAGSADGSGEGMAKLLAAKACLAAVEACIQVHGGHAFVLDNDVITLWPLARLIQIAPLNNESILNQIAERSLGLPRSF
ncbi:acyl-CoA dehydrogenase family protein [Rhodococcus opacus]|jgi:hypothetical protein|uniref:acyl-CoA dehydrogenase family protein n=1 Tax=Rhodococcus opacus TaxID=37919 RepID=UPI002475E157|nr:acyl-CoA dehydrogenase family protein [Rhodococcus opacus]MDH6293401.1 acyl-CoA dehydrogenase [Rhodococcus opacus]